MRTAIQVIAGAAMLLSVLPHVSATVAGVATGVATSVVGSADGAVSEGSTNYTEGPAGLPNKLEGHEFDGKLVPIVGVPTGEDGKQAGEKLKGYRDPDGHVIRLDGEVVNPDDPSAEDLLKYLAQHQYSQEQMPALHSALSKISLLHDIETDTAPLSGGAAPTHPPRPVVTDTSPQPSVSAPPSGEHTVKYAPLTPAAPEAPAGTMTSVFSVPISSLSSAVTSGGVITHSTATTTDTQLAPTSTGKAQEHETTEKDKISGAAGMKVDMGLTLMGMVGVLGLQFARLF